MRSITLGVHVAGSPFTRRLYTEATYGYGMDEERDGFDMRRHVFGLGLGYFLVRSLNVRAFGNGLYTQGGGDWITRDPDVPCPHCPGELNTDITTSNSHFVRVGGGLSYSFWDRVSVYGSVVTMVYGLNVVDSTYVLAGMTVAFRTPWARKRMWY